MRKASEDAACRLWSSERPFDPNLSLVKTSSDRQHVVILSACGLRQAKEGAGEARMAAERGADTASRKADETADAAKEGVDSAAKQAKHGAGKAREGAEQVRGWC